MRQTYVAAFKDLEHITAHTEVGTTAPTIPQQHFLQVLYNISLYNHKQPMENIVPLLSAYKGSFSNQILTLKYCTYCMEKDKTKTYSIFVILRLLAKWVDTLEQAKKKKDVRLYEAVVESLELGTCTFEEFIVYLNYIGNDVVGLIKTGTEETKKKYPDLSKNPHLDTGDLTKFLSAILPKTLTNMMIPRNFFPPTLLKSTTPEVDILYSCQTVENVAQNRVHYITIVRTVIKTLLSMELEPSQTKELVLNCFKYYYLFHHDKNYSASQYVIESFKKMSSAVRFALLDEISLFFVVLRKLGKELFISYLAEKFGWVAETIKNNSSVMGINKAMFKPFFNMGLGNSLKIKVDAGKTEHYYMQIYDRFSLAYFCIRCLQHDITIRLFYMGKFDQPEGLQDKKLLVCSEKKEGIFEGSIQTIDQGIYMFQFDNSYAWMKAKTVAFDVSILVPIQIREHARNKAKNLIFQRHEHMNEVPYENVIGWIDENQIKLNSTSANVSYTLEGNVKVYNIKLVKNTGQAYEYETDSKLRFMRKLHVIEKDPNLFWLIEGYKIKDVSDVEKWLEGEFQPDKLKVSHEREKIGEEEEQMHEIEIQEQEHREEKSQAQLMVQDAKQQLRKEEVKEEVKEQKTQQKPEEKNQITEQPEQSKIQQKPEDPKKEGQGLNQHKEPEPKPQEQSQITERQEKE